MTGDDFACRICENTRGNRAHVAREMMFGRRELFDYVECGSCGCLQIARIPDDLTPYYPDHYGSFQPRRGGRRRRLGRFLRRQRARRCLGERSLLGGLAFRWLGPLRAPIWGDPDPYVWLRRCGVGQDSRIADVGCGSGSLLLALRDEGFRQLTGLDPLLPEPIDYGAGLRIHDRELAELDERFDLIMMHHAFEHVADPRATLRSMRRHLHPGGRVVLRMPVVPCLAWRTYGVDWLQLDAPRHLHIQSPASLERLATAEGFRVDEVAWDSFGAQFWGSEQYRKDIPLMDERSHLVRPDGSIFSPERIEAWERQAAELNARREGDQACFYLAPC